MSRFIYMFKFIIIIIVIALFVGCSATNMVNMTADTAVNKLSVYELQVGAKIKAENDYYDNVMESATDRINSLRKEKLPYDFKKTTKKFAEENSGKNAVEIASRIVVFIEKSKNEWKEQSDVYSDLMKNTQESLKSNRTNLELENAKIKKLKNKLRALSGARSQREMLQLLVTFARQVKTELDDLQENSKEAGASP